MNDFSSLASGRGLGDGGRPGSDRGPGPGSRRDPRDRAQLAAHPVSGRRILALFIPHRWPIAAVLLLIVSSSAIGLATPFLTKELVDVAIPQQNVRLLLILVGLMVGVAVATAVLGVIQTWISTTIGQRIMHHLRTPTCSPTSSASRSGSSPAPGPGRCSHGSPTTSPGCRAW